MWTWVYRIGVGLLVLVMAYRIGDYMARRSDPLPALPSPNGYGTLLAAAREVTVPHGEPEELGMNQILQLADKNRQSLEQVHQGLNMETGVPLRTERGWVERHDREVRQLKRVALALGIQARSESLNGRTNATAQHLLDIIFLGQALPREGVLSDGINGLVVETVGTAAVRGEVGRWDAMLCRSAAQELDRAEVRREQPERILKTQKDWSAASFGLVSRVGGRFLREADATRYKEFKRRYAETTRRTRRLMLELAARAVELETGQRVTNAQQLVPSVLKSTPLDPKNNAPMTEIPGPRE